MPVAGFVQDSATSLDAWINEGAQILYEKMISAYGPGFVQSEAELTTVANTTDYPLPADFFKLYGIDLNVSGIVRSLKPFENSERNFYRNSILRWRGWRNVSRYQIVGANLRLYPAPDATTGTIYYAPVVSTLTEDTDTMSFPNGWERYVVLYAAIQCMMKEESDTRESRIQLAQWDAELDELKQLHDMAFPHSTVDVDAVDYPRIW